MYPAQEDYSASKPRPAKEGIELPSRLPSTATTKEHERQYSEAELLVRDLVRDTLPALDTESTDDINLTDGELFSNSTTTLVNNVVDASMPSAHDLVSAHELVAEAIAGVPLPEEFDAPSDGYTSSDDSDNPFDNTGRDSPTSTGTAANAFVDQILAEVPLPLPEIEIVTDSDIEDS